MTKNSLLLLTLAACSSETGLRDLSFVADPDGGSLTSDEVTVEVPPGALSEEVTITVSLADVPAPGVATASPTWTFGPDGLQFATPITVRMAYDDATRADTMFWTDEAGTYRPIETWLDTPGWAEALVSHFSGGVVGADPCEDDDLHPEDHDDDGRGDDDGPGDDEGDDSDDDGPGDDEGDDSDDDGPGDDEGDDSDDDGPRDDEGEGSEDDEGEDDDDGEHDGDDDDGCEDHGDDDGPGDDEGEDSDDDGPGDDEGEDSDDDEGDDEGDDSDDDGPGDDEGEDSGDDD